MAPQGYLSRPFQELEIDADSAARRLLGSRLITTDLERSAEYRIVETEAYDETDPASHSYRGITKRTNVMFGPAGYLYVYFTYGMHYCCNVVVGLEGCGAAVLIRAIEPVGNISDDAIRRRGKTGIELTNGPAKLCQALDITTALNGHDLRYPPVQLILSSPLDATSIVTTTRIGISRAQEAQRRFFVKGSPYVSVMRRPTSV